MTTTVATAERDETTWVTRWYRTEDSPYGQSVRADLRDENLALYLRVNRFDQSWDDPDGDVVREALRRENPKLYLALMREDRRRRILADPGWHPRTAELLVDETPLDVEEMAREVGVERGAVWAWLKPRRPVSAMHPSLLVPDLEPRIREDGRSVVVCTAGWVRDNYLTSMKGRVDPDTGEIIKGRLVFGRARNQ